MRDRWQSLTYPDGRKLEYAYDGNGNRTLLKATVAGPRPGLRPYTYDDASRLDLVTDPASNTYDHGYDNNGNRRAWSTRTARGRPTPTTR